MCTCWLRAGEAEESVTVIVMSWAGGALMDLPAVLAHYAAKTDLVYEGGCMTYSLELAGAHG